MLMHSTARTLPSKILRRTIKNSAFKPVTSPNHPLNYTTRKMAMFGPRFYTQAEPNFSGLFRLIDEFDNYSSQQLQQQGGNGQHHPQQQQQQQPRGRRSAFNRLQIPTFTPKFDLKETETEFELHGELPGIEKDQVHIEFTDPQTIVVRGRAERSYTAGTPPAGLIDEGHKTSGAITQEGEQQQPAAGDDASERSSLHATVEDDVEEGRSTATSTAAATPASTTVELSKPGSPEQQQKQQQQQQQPQQPRYKYWISERSVGEFSRAFQLPARVEHDGVRASLNNGILTVTVPKAKKPEARRIAIS